MRIYLIYVLAFIMVLWYSPWFGGFYKGWGRQYVEGYGRPILFGMPSDHLRWETL